MPADMRDRGTSPVTEMSKRRRYRCPHCGSGETKIADDKKSAKCRKCSGAFLTDAYWDPSDNSLVARLAWKDRNVRRLVEAGKEKVARAREEAKKQAAMDEKRLDALRTALKAKGWTEKFAKADFGAQAMMIGKLADQGLIPKN